MKKGAHTAHHKHTNHVLWLTLIIVALLAVGLLYTKKPVLFGSDTNQVANQKEKKHTNYEEPAPEKQPVMIKITETGFEPAVVTVKVNENVIGFINEDSVSHAVKADMMNTNAEGMFNTGAIAPGQQLSAVEYTQPGTYTYSDTTKPNAKGTIIVEK